MSEKRLIATGVVVRCQCGCGEPALLAKRTRPDRGYRQGEPLPYLPGHQLVAAGLNTRFQPKSEVEYVEQDRGYETPCWVWQRSLTDVGYPATQQHRRYYERFKGAIPTGLHIDHLCRVRACVNPEHLEPVTPAENQRRGKNTKLSHKDVQEIKRLAGEGMAYRDLGRRFGVHNSQISRKVNGQRWAESATPAAAKKRLIATGVVVKCAHCNGAREVLNTRMGTMRREPCLRCLGHGNIVRFEAYERERV